jgi:hypothetical protein
VDVVFSRPHRLHRLADRLREQHRIDQEIHVAWTTPAEAATDQRVVEGHFITADAERLGGCLQRHGLALRPAPHFGAIARG